MNWIRYYRHADKDGEVISPEGMKIARQIECTPRGYTDVFYTDVLRTAQTIMAMLTNPLFSAKDICIHSQPIGMKKHIGGMDMSRLMDVVKNDDYFQAILDACTQPEIEALGETAGNDVRDIFEQMNGDTAIFVGHDPVVSLAGMHFGWENPRGLKPLEFIDFALHDDGNITVVRTP